MCMVVTAVRRRLCRKLIGPYAQGNRGLPELIRESLTSSKSWRRLLLANRPWQPEVDQEASLAENHVIAEMRSSVKVSTISP